METQNPEGAPTDDSRKHNRAVLVRIVHTSDWHIGRIFGPVSLHHNQVTFGHKFVRIVKAHEADVAVSAGDIYDRPVAATEVIELFRLLKVGVPAFVSLIRDGLSSTICQRRK